MINYKWTDEDVRLVEKFIELKAHGYYCDGAQLTTVYNRVLNKHVTPTNCGSCIRARITELEAALNHFKSKIEVVSSENKSVEGVKVDDTPQDENKAKEEAPVKPNRKRK